MKRKLLGILLCAYIILGTTGCGKHGILHEYDDFINYVNNLQCGINGKETSCNLEGKYELVNTEDGLDEYNEKTRTYTFKIKDSDFSFKVESAYNCTGHIDGSCYDYTYTLTDLYHISAFEYYLNEYNKKVDFDNKLQYYPSGSDESLAGSFDIKTLNELNYITNYMNDFLDFANSLNFKFIDDHESFSIEFTENKYGYENGWHYSLDIYFDIDENGKYTFEFKDEYYPSDMKLETYINNFINENGIIIK